MNRKANIILSVYKSMHNKSASTLQFCFTSHIFSISIKVHLKGEVMKKNDKGDHKCLIKQMRGDDKKKKKKRWKGKQREYWKMQMGGTFIWVAVPQA